MKLEESSYKWHLVIHDSSYPSTSPFRPTSHMMRHFRLWRDPNFKSTSILRTATAGTDVVQSGRLIFDDFFQHFWPYIGNNTANVAFQMVKRLWLIRIDE
ncbi:hypothetical protein TNCV_4292521 [Trichonephila clavipes]|uniref:Uncharacterized protein n=1 Tax=Trichonephila clavipes TaxID=2585209 RepID=A0A8X6RKA8_TRICX|nr:hypothetical protein TNCV_4292521 [Trichonephila clavipes]